VLYPRILVYEGDGALARLLRPLAEARRWSLREPRRPEACLALLRRGDPGVLVLKLGQDVVRELGLLERVHWLHPNAASLVVADVEDASLDNLAWELGAACVWTAPRPRDLLPAIVAGLMEAAISRQRLGHEALADAGKGAGPPSGTEHEASRP
jgi:hypothetical protein